MIRFLITIAMICSLGLAENVFHEKWVKLANDQKAGKISEDQLISGCEELARTACNLASTNSDAEEFCTFSKNKYGEICLEDTTGLTCHLTAGLYLASKDMNNAEKYFDIACKAGIGNSCTMLGAINGKNNRYADAAKFFKKGCDLKSWTACGGLSGLYAQGMGVKQDIKKAKEYSKKGCDGNYAPACRYLGIIIYYEENNKKRAKSLFTKACELGDGEACEFLREKF